MIIFPPEGFVITVFQFDPAIFTCTAAGFPPPDISWFTQEDESITLLHNNTIIHDPVQRQDYILPNVIGEVFSVNRSLTLTEVMNGDDGRYTCIVNSSAGDATREFQLIVQGMVTHQMPN